MFGGKKLNYAQQQNTLFFLEKQRLFHEENLFIERLPLFTVTALIQFVNKFISHPNLVTSTEEVLIT